MAELDYSTTILIIKPVGPAATRALQSNQNINRLHSFHFDDAISTFPLYNNSRSRECTPYAPPPLEIELHLKFNPAPKEPSRGFVFGVNEDKCDVVLVDNPKEPYGISREHFYIDFNWVSGYVRMNNISRFGTGVRAPSVKTSFQLLKHNDRRMLLPVEHTRVSIGSLHFDLSFPIRDQQQEQLYRRNWEEFRTKCGHAVPSVGGLDIQPRPEVTQFRVRRESSHRAYLLHDEIGSGHFGIVCKATDERTGELFAAKQYKVIKSQDPRRDLEITLSQKVKHVRTASYLRPRILTDAKYRSIS